MDCRATLYDILGDTLKANEPMSGHTTLRVGGPARWFWSATNADQLVQVLHSCVEDRIPYLFVGHGSNLLMSDRGFDGLVIKNRLKGIDVGNQTYAESGVTLGSLYSAAARAGFAGLEWAIGIPGTVGGALVSNAGAYRGNIGPLVRSVRVFDNGLDESVGPEWMQFAYRDSRIRRSAEAGGAQSGPVILSCVLHLSERDDPAAIAARAKEYQAQRRAKQPFAASAGSFFKNVNNHDLAATIPGLSAGMVANGVVPAGFLSEACGLKGLQVGGAQVSQEHANFLINAGGATASDLRRLAETVKARVREQFGVTLDEEVLYVGDWADWASEDCRA